MRLIEAIRDLRTPAVVYDAARIDSVVGILSDDLAVVPRARLSFAVKANRSPAVLRYLARRDLGADVASLEELRAAETAGFTRLHATTPWLTPAFADALAEAGVLPDLNGLSALRSWLRRFPNARDVGLRLRTRVAPSDDAETLAGEWSKFGVDLDDELRDLLRDRDLHVRQVHVHCGELTDFARGSDVFTRAIAVAVELRADLINVGGGLLELYRDRRGAQDLWRTLAVLVDSAEQSLGKRLEVIVEPGMLLLASAGYLVTGVVAVDKHPSGTDIAVVDASAWNLVHWYRAWFAGQVPERESRRRYAIAGCTCYERDYFAIGVDAATLAVSDRVVFGGMGAYATSMARTMHGLSVPDEWLLTHAGLERGDAA
jgi:diaminopimelate decarboxylase